MTNTDGALVVGYITKTVVSGALPISRLIDQIDTYTAPTIMYRALS